MSYFPPMSQLIAGRFQIKVDANGYLGVFNDAGTEVMRWGDASNGAVTVLNSQFQSSTTTRLTGMVSIDGIPVLGRGVPPIYGVDNRSGITVVDGAPITLYSVPAGPNQLYDAAIEIDATTFTSGTATYTLTYTENGVSQTIVVTATALNIVSGVRRLIQPDASTLVTVQLTGAFVATLRLSAALLQLVY